MTEAELEEERRKNERRDGYCPSHIYKMKEQERMKLLVYKQSGMLAIILLFATAFAGSFWLMSSKREARFEKAQTAIMAQMKETRSVVQEVNESLLVFVAGHMKEAVQGLHDIELNKVGIKENSLEIKNNSKEILLLRSKVDFIENGR